MRHVPWILLAVSTLMLSWGGPSANAAERLPVFVSILPQADLVRRIGGDRVDVRVLVGPGQSPATYEPSPRQMGELGRARVFFRIGVPFEKGLMGKIADLYPQLEIIDTQKGVPLRYFEGPGSSREPDPHIWLDPGRLKIQAQTVSRVLEHLDPPHASLYRENREAFEAELRQTRRRIQQILHPFQGKELLVFHPAFGYFCEAFGLRQVAVEQSGKEPSARRLARLIDEAKGSGVRAVFVEPQYPRKQAQVLARAVGARVVLLNPLPRDCLSGLTDIARGIADGLKGQGTGNGVSPEK
jgi:zinc transport system substrate-binding protein